MAEKTSYNEKFKQLEKLVDELEQNEALNIDELRKKITEAKKIYDECQEVLRKTEDEIQSLSDTK